MTINEKVEEIKKAVQSGLPKRTIDMKGNGVKVRLLLKGKRVSEECIEELYSNLLKYRENPCEARVRLEKYSNSHPEVPQKEKVKAIRKAIKSGTKKNDLDPFGGGDAVRKLEKGKGVGSGKINEMYANLLFQKKGASKPAPERSTKGGKERKSTAGNGQASKKRLAKEKASGKSSGGKMPSTSDECLKTKFLEQKEQIATLLEKVRILEEKVGELSVAVNPRTPLKVLGLTVTQKLDIVKGKKYRRWYAIYRANGTRQWIYVGKDVSKAEEKIQSWLEKKGSNHGQSRSEQ